MAEELKLTMPKITKAELETIDNNLHEIANEFIKSIVKDKDLLLSQHIIKRLEEENKRLKQWDKNKDTRNSRQRIANKKLLEENQRLKEFCCKRNECSGRLKENHKLTCYEIINELEKWLEERIKSYEDRKKLGLGYELTFNMVIELACDKRYLRKLKELKGSDSR